MMNAMSETPGQRWQAADIDGLDALLAALAFYLAFQIRFIDASGGIPDRYDDMLVGSIVFVAVGKAIVFSAEGNFHGRTTGVIRYVRGYSF